MRRAEGRWREGAWLEFYSSAERRNVVELAPEIILGAVMPVDVIEKLIIALVASKSEVASIVRFEMPISPKLPEAARDGKARIVVII